MLELLFIAVVVFPAIWFIFDFNVVLIIYSIFVTCFSTLVVAALYCQREVNNNLDEGMYKLRAKIQKLEELSRKND